MSGRRPRPIQRLSELDVPIAACAFFDGGLSRLDSFFGWEFSSRRDSRLRADGVRPPRTLTPNGPVSYRAGKGGPLPLSDPAAGRQRIPARSSQLLIAPVASAPVAPSPVASAPVAPSPVPPVTPTPVTPMPIVVFAPLHGLGSGGIKIVLRGNRRFGRRMRFRRARLRERRNRHRDGGNSGAGRAQASEHAVVRWYPRPPPSAVACRLAARGWRQGQA
jgi:hypothetical protein